MSETLTLALGQMRQDRQHATQHAGTVATATACAAIAVVTALVYLVTLAPDLYSLDSPELAAAAYRLGIAHPPGYPLYTLSGWLFSHAFPIGNVAFRLNLFSALFGVVATLLTYLLAARLTRRPLVAAAAALSLAFSYYFWADALAAEIYTLDAALFAGLLLAAVLWRERPSAPRAAAAGLMLGLGLATRTTTLLYVPALAVFAYASGARSAGAWCAATAGAAAGLLFYLYLPLRSAAGVGAGPGDYGLDGSLRVWDLATLGGFWDHVSAAAFRHDVFAYGPVGLLRQTAAFGGRLAASFLVVGVPLGVAGAVRQWRADRVLFVLFAGTAAPLTLFFISYGALDKEFMFLPAYVVWALWMALGMTWAIDACAGAGTVRAWRAGAATLVLPAAALAVNAPLVSLHNEHRPRQTAEAFLAHVPQGAVVYGPFLDIAPFQYLQEVEGERTDVRLVNSWTVDNRFLLALAAANVGVRPFLITHDEPVLRSRYTLAPAGQGYEVRAKNE